MVYTAINSQGKMMLAKTQQDIKLPTNFTSRPARMDDMAAVIDLINHCSMAQIGVPEAEESEMKGFWGDPKLDMDTSTRLVFDTTGKLVAYADVDDTSSMPVHPFVWARVHPDYEGMGVGSALLQWGETTLQRTLTRVPEDIRVAIRGFALSTHEPAKQLFINHGFQLIRHFWRMVIEFAETPPQPVWPEGITVTTFDQFQDFRAVVAATDDGFKDHWGYVEKPLDEQVEHWRHWIESDEHHDPTLWFLAMEGEEITAVSLCRPFSTDDREMGWVNQLAVRRPWRRRGLGLALLHHSFGEFYRRGQKRAGLGVDAGSLTNATRLYEKAGMHVSRQYDTYEKVLRNGKNVSTETL